MPDNLQSVRMSTLTMQECTNALYEGKVILVKGLEQLRDQDVLVRLNTKGKVPVTQVSFDKIPPDGYWRDQYWIVYDLPLNVFSTYSCFLYDELLARKSPKYVVSDTVYYTSKEDSTRDSAIVVDVLKDEEENWYYKLSRDGEIYAENEVTKDRLK